MHYITESEYMTSPELLESRADHPSYEQVAELDPLEVDKIMEYLPQLNAEQDVEAIHEATVYATENAAGLMIPTRSDALASIRDLDFLASSVLRHGEQPLETVPGLESQLIRLGKVAKTVPRGTVFTYAAANPVGERRRSFTGTEAEEAFIEAVTRSIVMLDGAVDAIGKTSLRNDARLAEVLSGSSVAMDEMIDSIVQVRRTVTPEFFTFQMRPFFEPLVIDGESLTGAGGAQMQLVAVDRMLWGCEDKDPDYEAFFAENWQYLTPAQQNALDGYLRLNGGRSIVGWLAANPEASDETRGATVDLLKKIKKFRYPHRRIAQDNFKLRPSDAVGSGTYTPDILDVLIDKTAAAITRVEETRNA
jgi:hypothetical protein